MPKSSRHLHKNTVVRFQLFLIPSSWEQSQSLFHNLCNRLHYNDVCKHNSIRHSFRLPPDMTKAFPAFSAILLVLYYVSSLMFCTHVPLVLKLIFQLQIGPISVPRAAPLPKHCMKVHRHSMYWVTMFKYSFPNAWFTESTPNSCHKIAKPHQYKPPLRYISQFCLDVVKSKPCFSIRNIILQRFSQSPKFSYDAHSKQKTAFWKFPALWLQLPNGRFKLRYTQFFHLKKSIIFVIRKWKELNLPIIPALGHVENKFIRQH